MHLAFFADRATQLEAVHLWKHDVEDDRGEAAVPQHDQPFARPRCGLQAELKLSEVRGEWWAKLIVIIDQKKATLSRNVVAPFCRVSLAACHQPCGP